MSEITPALEQKIQEYHKYYTNLIFSGQAYEEFSEEGAVEYVKWFYQFNKNYNLKHVVICENPLEVNRIADYMVKKYDPDTPVTEAMIEDAKANALSIKAEANHLNILYFNNVNAITYIAFHKFIRDELKKTTKVTEEMNKIEELFMPNIIFESAFFEQLATISKPPLKVKKNEDRRLHCLDGYAVEWAGTYFPCTFVNGRHIDPDIFERVLNRTYTLEEWMKEGNQDVRANVATMMGPDFKDFIDAVLVDEIEKTYDVYSPVYGDEWVLDPETDTKHRKIVGENYHKETEILRLYETKEVIPEIGNKLKWVEFKCPSTGSSYLLDVNPKYTTAESAAKSLLARSQWMSEEENQALDYAWSGRS